jgi:hypothetical protein
MMIWLPALKEALNDSPVPISPSESEVHTRDAPVREPSSGSVAVPVKAILTPVSKDEPGTGLVMFAVGAALAASTVMLTNSAPTTPWLSVAVRETVWCPMLKEALKEPPVPSCPSTFEAQTNESSIRGPSSGSLADPLKTMLSAGVNVSPFAGLTMVVVGGPLGGGASTMIPTLVLTATPSLLVASKPITWLPAVKEAPIDSPVPSSPSTSEVHVRVAPAKGLPSGLLADPLNTIVSLVRNVSPTVGFKMVTVAGGAAGASTMMFKRVRVRVSSRLSVAVRVIS